MKYFKHRHFFCYLSQVPADHLLSASVMSAPAALAISKLTYPEIEVPIISPEDYEYSEKVYALYAYVWLN